MLVIAGYAFHDATAAYTQPLMHCRHRRNQYALSDPLLMLFYTGQILLRGMPVFVVPSFLISHEYRE